MANYNSPGIYIEDAPKRIVPIKISNKCVTGFIGIAEKGPLNKGTRIKDFSQFLNIFGGFINYGYLAYAVYGFFNSGGEECIVVRIAHTPKKKDSETDDTFATKAFYELENQDGKTGYIIRANSEGIWGNGLSIKLWHTAYATTRCESVNKEKNCIIVASTQDIERDDYLCLRGQKHFEYVKVKSIEKNRIYLTSGLKKKIDPEKEKAFCEKLLLNIVVMDGKKGEEYLYVSPKKTDNHYFVDRINAASHLITIEEKETGLPGELFYVNLKHGKNGMLNLTPADFIGYFNGLNDNAGIGVFKSCADISLIASPDVLLFQELIEKDREKAIENIFIVQKAIIDHCEAIGNRFAVLDTPIFDNAAGLIDWRARFDSKCAAMYCPRIEIINPEDVTKLSTLVVPPSGHTAGVYAYGDRTEGVFSTPANKYIRGAVGLEQIIEKEVYDVLYPKGINCFKYIAGSGVKIWGARTLSSEKDWRYINVRRTFSTIRDAVRKGTGWAVFEPNNSLLRKRLVRHVYAFLLDLWRQGYMKGKIPEEGFYIRCDDELNPPEEVDAGRINIEVGLSIARPAEFLVLKLTANTEDSIVTLQQE
ncbi:MAG: phage tail sheath family protein [Spirochaetales bacterium]|nr:phage tail sheath family protein [Spirochaetales bacterium]